MGGGISVDGEHRVPGVGDLVAWTGGRAERQAWIETAPAVMGGRIASARAGAVLAVSGGGRSDRERRVANGAHGLVPCGMVFAV